MFKVKSKRNFYFFFSFFLENKKKRLSAQKPLKIGHFIRDFTVNRPKNV